MYIHVIDRFNINILENINEIEIDTSEAAHFNINIIILEYKYFCKSSKYVSCYEV